MPDMTTEEQISRIQDERADARQDLHDTLSEMNAKVGRAEDGLRPDRMIENHSAGAALIAAGIGFLVGSTANNQAAGPIMIAALLGFALSRRGSKESSQAKMTRRGGRAIEPESNSEE
jgi:uncharacterized iron-regulated protein